MPVRFFNMRGVPEDEAEEIRALLTSHAIDFYETPAGNWGFSVPAIWLNDEAQQPRARALLDEYQRERVIRVRNEYAQLKKEGRHRTILDIILEDPVRVILYLAAIVALIYFSTIPFIGLGLD